MQKSRQTLTISILLILGMLAALGASACSGSIPAASAAGITPTPQPGGPMGEYRDLFTQSLLKRLGIDESQLKSAVTGALTEALDQAVKDGKLTQEQADKIKSLAEQRSDFGLPMPFGKGQRGGPGSDKGRGGKEEGGFGFKGRGGRGGLELSAAATALGLSEQDLLSKLQSGKSIAEIAKEQNIDLAKVKEALLAEAKASLDQAVKDGKLTQAQADQAYQRFSENIDDLLNKSGMPGKNGDPRGGSGGPRDRGFGGMDLSGAAMALGLSEQDLLSKLQSGKSIAEIAKEQNVDLARVKESLLSSLKTRMDQAVKDGKLTQAQADQMYQRFSENIDTWLNNSGMPRRGFQHPNVQPQATPEPTS